MDMGPDRYCCKVHMGSIMNWFVCHGGQVVRDDEGAVAADGRHLDVSERGLCTSPYGAMCLRKRFEL